MEWHTPRKAFANAMPAIVAAFAIFSRAATLLPSSYAIGRYSNIVLNGVLGEYTLSKRDVALATALFYGVLDRRITIDYILKKLINTAACV